MWQFTLGVAIDQGWYKILVMNSFDPQNLLTRAFTTLRQKRFQIGVGELLAARQAVEGGFGEDAEALAATLKLLWCHSPSAQIQFDAIWKDLLASSTPKSLEKPSDAELAPEPRPGRGEEPQELQQPQLPQDVVTESTSALELAALPTKAPSMLTQNEDTSVLQAYYPISRRSMAYGWRYLRRLVADGVADVLDEEATIEQATRQGFYLAPVYRRRERNQAQLLLLLDQNGSMTPFHRFSRDLVETVCYESDLQGENIKVFYFHNVPAASVYKDLYLTEPVELKTVLSQLDNETSVLIISDAGAARGYRKLERIRATTSFLFQLKRHTTLIAWLNPMPEARWIGSSAEILANLVPMYQMDNDGLDNAIDILRGLLV